MPDGPGYGVLAALTLFMGASVWLGALARRATQRGGFLMGYFQGNRRLGSWALALTATVQSGGTFMGFPSLVYSFGWVTSLWIASYMVVPITGFAIIGKRLAHLARQTGALTIPELLMRRFDSGALGITASLLIMFYMTFSMVAQFKAGALLLANAWPWRGESNYLVGLLIFTLIVVGYTAVGGFLAAVWTDLFQSVLMLIGVLVLVLLVIPMAGGMEQASRTAMEQTGPEFALGPGFSPEGRMFHPLGLAVSFFFIWVFSGFGSPASMVRVMASDSTQTMRHSIFLLSVYNTLIYLPLILICICARALLPELEVSDEVVPRLAVWSTRDLPGGSVLAGLILAAPFGAVMATVSTYLVVIASGLVVDVYHRFVNPHAGKTRLRLASMGAIALVGAIGVVANLQPVRYLQALVVFSGTGTAATFVVPMVLAVYWRRCTRQGILAAMLAGTGTHLTLFAIGVVLTQRGYDPLIGPPTDFRPYFLLDMEPLVWSLVASLVAGVVVSRLTPAPDPGQIAPFFEGG